jgi:hypothetical protein
MMHVRVSLVSADRRVLAGCLGYLEHGARPVLESRLAKIMGPKRAQIGKASGYTHRSFRPDAVRYLSVTTAMQRRTAAHPDT